MVYISLGTILKGAVSFFQNCIEAFRDENVDVIISVGKQFDIRKLKNIPENVHVYESVPQLTVLKMADVFVTHGGMNSVSEALYLGTPMVVIPFVSDQPVNAQCVEKLGVGKKMEYANVDKDSLKGMIFDVLTDAEIKKQMEIVRAMVESAPGNAGGAELVIENESNFTKKR